MRINVEKMADRAVVTVHGTMDAVLAGELDDALEGEMDEGQTRFVLDLCGVRLMCSAGLRVLAKAVKRLYGKGGIVLAGPNDNVREMLESVGFDKVLSIQPDLTTAEAALPAVQKET